MKLPTLQSLMRKYLQLPRKKLWIAALKLNRAPVVWWDEQVEARRKKEELRKKKIDSLYPKKK
tara:strand:+ start:221 stop:409 length:189 start_codon:yes stop_codon:yes gene_type:complete